jgi:PAS domain S-box-containing protein
MYNTDMTAIPDEQKTRAHLIAELDNLRGQVSQLKASVQANKQAGELLHIFRINSPVGLFIVQDGKFVFTNKQFQKIMGIAAEKLVGTISLEWVHPEDRQMVRESSIKMLNRELNSPYGYRIITSDGQIRWVLEGVISVQFRGRRAVLGHAMDVTDRIKAELALQKRYDSEKKLRRQLEREVNKRIEYTRALVHELKTPLTPILFSSELLVSELKEEPWASIARNIHSGATNLNNRIGELLDLARVEIGSLTLNISPVDPHQLLERVVQDIESYTRKNNQRLVLNIPESLPEIRVDSERLQQVILNLLVNASKFTPENGAITLSARQEGENFLVAVSDTGRGIPRREQKRIFEPYERRPTDRERLSGLGLGLALCRYLIKLHRGKIWVESRPGKGATFSFLIPLNPPSPPAKKKTKEPVDEAASD